MQNHIVIAFDLHNVIFCLNKKRVLSLILKTKKILLLNLFGYFLSPRFWYILHQTNVIGSSEERFNFMVARYPKLRRYKHTFIEICNQQDPIPGMLTILKNLSTLPHVHLIVASNIGRETCEKLIFTYPVLKTVFENFFTSGSTPLFFKKPSQNYFISLKDLIRAHYPKAQTYLFIDDKKNNIKSAKNQGFHTILFEDTNTFYKKLEEKLNICNTL